MRRIYHHHDTWEEAPMWRRDPAAEREAKAAAARRLILDAPAFRACMERVIDEWPVSCEHNLTDLSLNRAAWLWHAGAHLAVGASEETTRSIWMTLTDDQRRIADKIAWDLVYRWQEQHTRAQSEGCQRDLWEQAS